MAPRCAGTRTLAKLRAQLALITHVYAYDHLIKQMWWLPAADGRLRVLFLKCVEFCVLMFGVACKNDGGFSIDSRRNRDVQAYATLMCQQHHVTDRCRKLWWSLCVVVCCPGLLPQQQQEIFIITISSVTWAGTQAGSLCSQTLPPQYTQTRAAAVKTAVKTCRVLQPSDNRKVEVHTNQLHSNGNSHSSTSLPGS